jgi:predicted thioesterase
MKPTLAVGVSGTREYAVDRASTIDFMGDSARVYATPALVRDIEVTCRDLLLAHLDAGEDSVGTRVELDHLAPTLLGMKATITAKIVELKGRAVTFEVSASDSIEPIGRCKHSRFIVNVKQTEQRLAAKAQKAKAA